MNPRVMEAAHEALAGLGDAEKREAKALPGRLRATGLLATLEWLGKHRKLKQSLLDHLGLESEKELERAISSVSFLEYMRRAAAFAEALHLLARAERGQGGSR